MNIQKAIEECLADLSLAKATERAYRNGINNFLIFLKKEDINPADDVTVLNIDHFISFYPWLDKIFSKQTSGVYGAGAKAFMNYLVITKIFTLSYLDTLRFNKSALRSHRRHEDKLPRFPEKNDVDKMLSAVHSYNEESPRKERNIALLEFLASSGCRISEVTALNIQDIDLENRSVIVVGKGNKERRVFFSQTSAIALSLYWKTRESNMATDPIFGRHDKGAGNKRIKRMTPTTARNIVKDIAIIAGIDPTKFSPHYFRHAFAIRVLAETGNLALAQDLLGHKDPKSTRVYAKIHSDDLRDKHRLIFN
jgi:site-specific recombinase XerD